MTADILPKIDLGRVQVTRLILGGNPFCGFSHQSHARDMEMLNYYKVERIKETLRRAEAAGINTFVMRLDAFTLRLLREYHNEGGGLQWIAQIYEDAGGPGWSWKRRFEQALSSGAKACYLHGDIVDNLYNNQNAVKLAEIIEDLHSLGGPVGIAGHNPKAHIWANGLGIPIDFHMVCFYDCGSVHAGKGEQFKPDDPFAAVDAMRRIKKSPCIGYKIMGAGRVAPRVAFEFAFANIKSTDCVNVGIYRGDNDNMVEENVAMVKDIFFNQTILNGNQKPIIKQALS